MLVATVGQNLRRIRESKGVTQETLAARLGLKRSAQISIVESSPALPKPTTIVSYAEALKVKPSELMQDVETDYDRLRKGLPVESKASQRQQPVRKIAVGESPPVGRPLAARGRSTRSR